ncbi:MAG: glycoside hydrolase family 3 N-terminal domain-containing protein, partial [Arcobacteraceae bacterium]
LKQHTVISFCIVILLSININAKENTMINDIKLKKMIGQMLIIGFDDTNITEKSSIVQTINKYNIAGVILFDRFYKDKTKVKNIQNPKQLQLLTSNLKKYTNNKLIISIDQEGGKVQRLKQSYGFPSTLSAKNISQKSIKEAKEQYHTMSNMLSLNGINTNFAPVVDLSINKENFVINGLERSYGSNPEIVTQYASIFMEELQSKKILSVLKHFPGHGSSKDDSHKGFVDISNTWSELELDPYKNLIKQNKVDMIMTAHVFNRYLDEIYPATLSYKVNTQLLREKINYKGVIVSDDLQMKAVSQHYNLKDTVTLVINAGVDILLFGNQLASQDTDELINTIFTQVKNGSISYKRIIESNKKINQLKTLLD